MKTKSTNNLWFTPVCDIVLRKIAIWWAQYTRGDPSADRPFMSMDGKVIDKITRFANRLKFTDNELGHLVRVLDSVAPADPLNSERMLVEYFRKIKDGAKRGQLLPGGEREVVLDAYKQDVEEVLRMLVRAKTGELKTMDDFVKEQTETGESPFTL